MWELIQEYNLETTPSEDGVSPGEEVLAISIATIMAINTPKIVRLKGIVQGIEVLILIDSGSTHSFVGKAFGKQAKKGGGAETAKDDSS